MARNVDNQEPALFGTWADDFWAFSGQLYGQLGMQRCCLTWQDDYAGQVNGVLFAIWCDVRGYSVLTSKNLTQLNAVIDQSHQDDVAPIREARLSFSDKSSVDYQAALQAELAAEQRQQIAIIKWALTHAVTSPHTSTLDQGCSDKDTRLLQTQLYLQHHIEHYICDTALKNSAIALTNNIESIAQRALPSV